MAIVYYFGVAENIPNTFECAPADGKVLRVPQKHERNNMLHQTAHQYALFIGTKHFGDWSSLREKGETATFSGFNKAGSVLTNKLLLQKLQRAFGGRFLL